MLSNTMHKRISQRLERFLKKNFERFIKFISELSSFIRSLIDGRGLTVFYRIKYDRFLLLCA